MKMQIMAIAALIALGWSGNARAEPITYSEQATLSGSLNGVSFTNALVNITAVGDTTAVVYDSTDSEYHTLATSTTVMIAGFASVSFTDKIEVVDAQGVTPGVFRIYDVTANASVLGVADPYFSSYNLQNSFTPITDTQTHAFNNPYATTGGTLILTANGPGNMATASASTPLVIPEPSSIVLTGLAGVLVLGFRVRSADSSR